MSNRTMVLIIACLLMIPAISTCEENGYWQNGKGEKVESETNIKAMGDFGAHLLLTDDKDYMKKWEQSTDGFYIQGVHSALRKQPIFVLITFANPGVGENGLCDITADILVKAPNGKLYGEIKDADCWQNMSAPPKGNIQLGKVSMGIVIEDKDSSGRYTVDAIVKDHNKNTELPLSDYFDVK
jgi:hypothetical protein